MPWSMAEREHFQSPAAAVENADGSRLDRDLPVPEWQPRRRERSLERARPAPRSLHSPVFRLQFWQRRKIHACSCLVTTHLPPRRNASTH